MSSKININLYSRQISTYGMDLMLKLVNMKVIIIGMRGLGLEIAKNIILAGIDTLSIFDDHICSISDLSSNFYISEDDINKKRRDDACLKKLKKLNLNAQVNKFDTLETLKNSLEKYDILVITEIIDTDIVIELNELCRKNKKNFIYTSTLGLSGFVFTDFGDEHTILNKTGDEPKSLIIKNITKEKEGKVIVDTEKESISLYEFSDYVIFKNIKGMVELNNNNPVQIKVLSRDCFSIGDTSNYNDYISGGIAKEIFIPFKKKFFSFQESFYEPFKENLLGQTINMKKRKKELFHICLIGIHHFLKVHNSLPEINNENHIKEIISHIKLINNIGKNKEWIKKIKLIDENYLKFMIRWCKCSISPICSFLGGIVSQEIVKITGKYNPISQWLYFDFFEKLNNINLNNIFKPLNSRYDEQISIFGEDFQKKLSNINLFMVGAGALGCEFLKIFSLMGIGEGKNKCITVTDNDNVELSNLSRQFFFREKHIGKSKSEIACEKAKKINKNITIKNYDLKVSYDTENIFNDSFWEEQDLIIGAVDNDNARRYIDNQCTFYNKIFLESGTSGTSASSMVIYPHKTICYDDLEKVLDKEIPMCTLKSFPYLIEHCIEFSKIYFIEIFEKNIEDLNLLIKDYVTFFKKAENSLSEKKNLIGKLNEFLKLLNIFKNKNEDELIKYFLEKHDLFFYKNIEDLITKFPDNTLDENGEKFWKGSKIMPHPIPFEINNDLSKNFVYFGSKIFNNIFNLNFDIKKIDIENNFTHNIIKEKKCEDYSELEQEKIISDLKGEIISILKNDIFKDIYFKPEKFEKDNDENFHIDFLFYFSNLRANNYNIENCDREKVRAISGKIIPAIAATTACIAGFVSVQIYSVLLSDDIKLMRNLGLDLGTSWYSCGIPEEVRINKSIEKVTENFELFEIPKNCSVWDNIKIKGPLSVKQIIEFFKNGYNFDIDFINSNNECLVDLIDDENQEDLNNTIEKLYMDQFKQDLKNKKYINLMISGTQNDIDIKIPRIKYILKNN